MENLQEQQFLNDIVRVPCPSCGSQLTYSAGTQKLRCAHCGYQEMINNANDLVVEKSLSDAADKIVNFIPEKVGKKVLKFGFWFVHSSHNIHLRYKPNQLT